MTSKLRYKVQLTCTMALFAMMVFSCGNGRMESEIKAFASSNVKVPIDDMHELSCGLYHDAVAKHSVLLVDYVDMTSCPSCVARKIASVEQMAVEHDESLGVLHIVKARKNDFSLIYDELCREHVRGIVYLDTCGAFLSANTQFPSSQLLHTFVMNRNGRVLLVGNPFRSERLMKLFKNVLAEVRGGEQTR